MDDSDTTEGTRLTRTFQIAALGVIAVLAALALALLALDPANDKVVPGMLGAVVAGIGTLVGAVAGHSAGASGKRQAEIRATGNEQAAANGRALARMMVADDLSGGASTARLAESGQPTQPEPETVQLSRRHADLAKSLFPDVTG
jgi:hypothetical protein